MLADQFCPLYDVSDEVAVIVEADAATTWRALLEADLVEVGRTRPLVGVLGALRGLPQIAGDLLRGRHPAGMPAHLTLRDTAEIPAGDGGWVLLGERPGQEIALGLVGRFWRPVIQYADVGAPAFRDFAEPGYAKTVYTLGVRPAGEGRTLLWGQMRTATTDARAQRWFRRYWTFGVGSGAHVLVRGLLELARDRAEAADEGRAAVEMLPTRVPARQATT